MFDLRDEVFPFLQVVLVAFPSFNKLWLTPEHRLVDLVSHLPQKFSERTRYCLGVKYKGDLVLQNIFFPCEGSEHNQSTSMHREKITFN